MDKDAKTKLRQRRKNELFIGNLKLWQLTFQADKA
jgi:hypothetical protein